MKKLLLLLSALTVIVFGGDFEDGLAAQKNKDYKKALELYKKAADQGNIAAIHRIGVCFYYGWGTETDYEKAKEYYIKAANLGDNESLISLGNMYSSGTGVERNKVKGCGYFTKAAEQGSKIGGIMLNIHCKDVYYDAGIENLYEGKVDEGLNLLDKAARDGNVKAQERLAYLYYSGKNYGVNQDKIKAYQYWLKAAKTGHIKSQQNLDMLCKESPWACK